MTDALSRVKAFLAEYSDACRILGRLKMTVVVPDELDKDVASLVQELEETRKQLERAEKALEWYSLGQDTPIPLLVENKVLEEWYLKAQTQSAQKDALIAKMQRVVDAARESYLVGEELEAALDALDKET